MAVQYKQKCSRCKKNFVLVTRRTQYPTCHECEEATLNREITDPEMKTFFDIPEELYKENHFLRSIKAGYLKFGSISEKQREAFLKTVKDMKEKKDE